MEIPKIEKLDELLTPYLGQHQFIIGHETTRLTATGENYGSQMLGLKIQVRNNEKTEVLDAVAKIPPPGEFIQRMFNIPVTFRNEFNFYNTIIPELESFLREKNLDGYLDSFPKFFGGRLSLDSNKDEVDNGATIILENLKVKGYEMLDRTEGFDLPTSKIIVKALAKYHVVPIGLKIQKPETFNTKIRALFQPYKVFDLDTSVFETIIEKYRTIIKETLPQYEQRVVDAFRKTIHLPKSAPETIREPLCTIIHTDAWVNNFMIINQDGIPKKCKIVDFQLNEYGSPLRDLLFFIFSSVKIPVVQNNYDDLIKLYHDTFINGLRQFECDLSPFSLEEFQKEIGIIVQEFEFFHCMMMLEPIFATKDSLKELEEYTEEDMKVIRPVPPKHKERATFIIEEFAKRNWI